MPFGGHSCGGIEGCARRGGTCPAAGVHYPTVAHVAQVHAGVWANLSRGQFALLPVRDVAFGVVWVMGINVGVVVLVWMTVKVRMHKPRTK